jgi:hypothetical protein
MHITANIVVVHRSLIIDSFLPPVLSRTIYFSLSRAAEIPSNSQPTQQFPSPPVPSTSCSLACLRRRLTHQMQQQKKKKKEEEEAACEGGGDSAAV